MVRHGVKKLIDAVATVDEEARRALVDGLRFDYEKPGEKPDCRWRIKAERERMLTQVAQDAERALRAVEQTDGLLDDEQIAAAYELLRELIGQDFDIDDDGVPTLHRGTASRRIISVVDPEMRHGRKSSSQRFDGYKIHAAASNSEVPLITAIDVTAASEQDGPQAPGLVDQQPEHRRPQRLLGDTAYGTGPVRGELAEREVDVLLRCQRRPCRKAGLLSATSRSIRRRHGHLSGRANGRDQDPALRVPAGVVRDVDLSRLPVEATLLSNTPPQTDRTRRRGRTADRRPPSARESR